MKTPAVFLDRDGTLNVDKEYLFRYDDWEWIPGVVDALKMLAGLGYKLVVVSNQSGVARGFYSESDVRILHDRVAKELKLVGVEISGFYFCPHGPESDCLCRKPKPGLILTAAKDLGIDLSRSFMVGDKMIDVEAGLAAGVRPILVGTGCGNREKKKLIIDVPFFSNLGALSQWVKESRK